MNRIEIEEKYILEYIRDTLNSMKIGKQFIDNSNYHHNSRYENGSSICAHGILSMQDLHRLGICDYDEKKLHTFADNTSHANGIDCISLARMGLTDLWPNEEEYNPYHPEYLDFLITSRVVARRYAENYGNEFLTQTSILPEQFLSIDIRMLELIRTLETKTNKSPAEILDVMNKYNCLQDIVLTLQGKNLYIPIREMSENAHSTLDIERLSKTPTLILKK